MNIDFNFIAKNEGECELTGYVPDAKRSQSGVTVATGFDLGARNEQDLARLGIKKNLIGKLKPYLGVKGLQAKTLVTRNPLNISQTDCLAIDIAVKTHFKEQMKVRYDSAANRGPLSFRQLPKEAATVLMSVAFQYGLNLRSATPSFWSQMVEQRWSDAVQNLENFGDRYSSRRKREANLLKGILN